MIIDAWVAPRKVMISNDEVAGFRAEAAGRLVGVGPVDPARPAQVRGEVRRCAGTLGFSACRCCPGSGSGPPTDRLFHPLYAACCEVGVPLCTQIGYPWTDEAVALVETLRGHGRHKLLFGSHWPMIAPAHAMAGLESQGLDDETRALFLGGNAQRVCRWPVT